MDRGADGHGGPACFFFLLAQSPVTQSKSDLPKPDLRRQFRLVRDQAAKDSAIAAISAARHFQAMIGGVANHVGERIFNEVKNLTIEF